MPDFEADPGFISQDQGTIYDYEASVGEVAGASFGRQMDTNLFQFVLRETDFLSEDLKSLTGESERVDQKSAQEEVRKRGLDLKIPVGGITRQELDTLQYLKQREIQQNLTMARRSGVGATVATFGAGLAAGATDPLNVASAFIPVVGEARYAAWLAKSNSFAGRAAIRAGVGATEGAVGAAVIEPIVYAGAQAEQFDYTGADSFLNVMFGTVLGGGLHVAGGSYADWRRMPPAAVAARQAAAEAPESVHLDATMQAVRALEDDAPVRAPEVFAEKAPTVPQELPPIRLADKSASMGGFREALIDEFRAKLEAGATPEARAFVLEDLNRYPVRSIERIIAALPEYFEAALDAAEGVDVAAVRSQDGRVFTAQTHAMALDKMADETGEAFDSLADRAGSGEIEQGFVTTKGRYVDRDEAAKIADAQKQTKESGKATFKPSASEPLISEHAKLGPRGMLDRLIKAARQERTADTFNRQFVDEYARDDADASTSAARDTEAELTTQDVESNIAQHDAHIESMRERGLLTPEDEAEIKAADEVAQDLEARAGAYEAAAACEMESA